MEKRRLSTWEELAGRQLAGISREREGAHGENRLAELQERCETLNRGNKGLAADKPDGGKGIVLVREQMVREAEERSRRFKEQMDPHAGAVAECHP